MPRSCAYAGEYPAESQCVAVCGIPKREKFADDIRQTCKSEVFPYPKAFENYLSYEDESLQANVSKTIGVIREEESDALRRRNAEYEALEKERIRERKAMLKKKRDAKTAAAAADIRARKKIEDAVNAKLAKQRETGCRKG